MKVEEGAQVVPGCKRFSQVWFPLRLCLDVIDDFEGVRAVDDWDVLIMLGEIFCETQ